jgi:periplasmic protein TonB
LTLSQRDKALVVSGAIHALLVMMILTGRLEILTKPAPEAPQIAQGLPPMRRVMLPTQEEIRQLLAPPNRRAPAPPASQPTPVAPQRPLKERISVGPPSEQRSRQLLLRREDDLTAVPKGTRGSLAPNEPGPGATPNPDERATQGPAPAAALGGIADRQLPIGAALRPGTAAFSESLRRIEERLRDQGTSGFPYGTGPRQMGPLFFDPAGADFTAWVNHFKNEVYRNWIVPQSALMGLRGRVDLAFAVTREGRLVDLRLLKGSGTPALDRAAQNALVSSRLLPLPSDYGPPHVDMTVSFFYNERPSAS